MAAAARVVAAGEVGELDSGRGRDDDVARVRVVQRGPRACAAVGIVEHGAIALDGDLLAVATREDVVAFAKENGLRGGNTYATEHAGEVANQFAAIETDGGADHPIGIYMAGKPQLKAMLEPIAKVLDASGAGLLQFRDEVGADIDPLAKLGVPNFSPMQDSRFYFNYHHTAADTLDKIDPPELAENAAINAVLAYGLANLEQPLPR